MAVRPVYSLCGLSLPLWMFGMDGHVKAALNMGSMFPTLLVSASVPGRAGGLC